MVVSPSQGTQAEVSGCAKHEENPHKRPQIKVCGFFCSICLFIVIDCYLWLLLALLLDNEGIKKEPPEFSGGILLLFFIGRLLFLVVLVGADLQQRTQEGIHRSDGSDDLRAIGEGPDLRQRKVERTKRGEDDLRYILQNVVQFVGHLHFFSTFLFLSSLETSRNANRNIPNTVPPNAATRTQTQ